MTNESVEQPVGPISSIARVPGQRPAAQAEKEAAKIKQLEDKKDKTNDQKEMDKLRELITAQKRGGPILTTNEMTQALKKQDETQKAIRGNSEKFKPSKETVAALAKQFNATLYGTMGQADIESRLTAEFDLIANVLSQHRSELGLVEDATLTEEAAKVVFGGALSNPPLSVWVGNRQVRLSDLVKEERRPAGGWAEGVKYLVWQKQEQGWPKEKIKTYLLLVGLQGEAINKTLLNVVLAEIAMLDNPLGEMIPVKGAENGNLKTRRKIEDSLESSLPKLYPLIRDYYLATMPSGMDQGVHEANKLDSFRQSGFGYFGISLSSQGEVNNAR